MAVTQDHRPMTYAKMKRLLSFFSGKFVLSPVRQVRSDLANLTLELPANEQVLLPRDKRSFACNSYETT